MNQNRNLTEILADIEATTKMANLDMQTVSFVSRQAMMIGKRQAQDRLGDLRNEYKNKILQNTVGFFLYGTPERTSTFAKVSHEDTGTVMIDAKEMYQFLADEVGPAMGAARQFNVDQMTRLYAEIRGICTNLGYDDYSIPAPQMKSVVTLKTQGELADYIRDRIRESIGDSLNARYITARVWEKALENKYTSPVLVCTVTNATLDEEQSLSCFNVKHNLTLDDDSNIDPSFISKMYEKYTKKNKKQTKVSE